MTRLINDLLLEKYLLQEVTADERKKVELLLETDDELKSRLAQMKKENSSFEARSFNPSKSTSSAISKNELSRFLSRLLTLPSLGFAVSFCLLILVGANLIYLYPSSEIRFKGEASPLHIYQNKNGNISRLSPNDRVSEGLPVQLSYQVEKESYGMIFSIDGRGRMTILFPEKGNQLAPLEAGKEVFLPSAMLLDDAPDAEIFYLVQFSNQQPMMGIVEKLREVSDRKMLREGNFSLPDLLSVHVFELKKAE